MRWDTRDALKYWVQICGPSAISPYLHTFLLNEVAIRQAREAGRWQKEFARLFSHILRLGLPMGQLHLSSHREDVFRARNAEEALLVTMNACARATRTISPVQHPAPTAFGAWFRRVQGQRTGPESSLAARCLSYMNLAGVCLDIADLYGADLDSSDLSKAHATLACLCQASLRNANLQQASFGRADLSGAQLQGANLKGANLRWADLQEALLESANLEGASVRGAALNAAVPPHARRLLSARGKEEAKEFRRLIRGSGPTDETPKEGHPS